MRKRPGSVVLVGHNTALCEALRLIFGEIGWNVREAGAVSEVAQLLTQSLPTLLLTEELLGDGDWSDVLHVAFAIRPQLPIVVTGHAPNESLWAEVLNRGGSDVLAQPLDRGEVIRLANSAWLHLHHRARTATV
jgi:DNA-binding NtrC family response regulator